MVLSTNATELCKIKAAAKIGSITDIGSAAAVKPATIAATSTEADEHY